MFNKTFGRIMFNENKRHVQGDSSIASASVLTCSATASYAGTSNLLGTAVIEARGTKAMNDGSAIVGPGAIYLRATGIRATDTAIECNSSMIARAVRVYGSPELIVDAIASIIADPFVFSWEQNSKHDDVWNDVPDASFSWTDIEQNQTQWKKVR